MVSVTTGLAAGVCVNPGPVRKVILGNSATRHPRTVARVGCPSTATRMLSAASMTQQGQSFWHTDSGGHIVIIQSHNGCEAANPVTVHVSLCACCTGLFKPCSQPAALEIKSGSCLLESSKYLFALCCIPE